MWDETEEEDGILREQELRQKYWNQMIDSGAQSTRLLNTPKSAWDVISQVNPSSRLPLLLQTEMVDERKELSKTSAGKSLFRWLADMMQVIKRTIKDLRATIKGTKRADLVRKQSLKAKLDKLEKRGQQVGHLMEKYCGSEETLISLSSTLAPLDCMSPPPTPSVEKRETPSSNRQFLQSTITALRIIQELAGLAPFPAVRSVMGLVLVIVENVEKTGGVNDALMEVSRNASALASSVAEIAHDKMSAPVQNCVTYFIRELTDISDAVKIVSSRGSASKFLLSTADRQRIDDCNRRLIFACSSLGAQVAVHNSISNARLEEKLDYVISILSGQPSHPTIAALAMRSNALTLSPLPQVQ